MGQLPQGVLANSRQPYTPTNLEQPLLVQPRIKEHRGKIRIFTLYLMNRRIPNGTYGGVRGRELATPSYSISHRFKVLGS